MKESKWKEEAGQWRSGKDGRVFWRPLLGCPFCPYVQILCHCELTQSPLPRYKIINYFIKKIQGIIILQIKFSNGLAHSTNPITDLQLFLFY